MNSFNHDSYRSGGVWLHARMAAIDWDAAVPGFRHVRLRPLFDRRIGRVDAAYGAITGQISSAWQIDGDTAHCTAALPANVSGTAERAQPPQAVRSARATPAPCGHGTRLILGPGRHRVTIAPWEETP